MSVKRHIFVHPRQVGFRLSDIKLEGASEEDLRRFSTESGTGLSIEELKRVTDYFRSKGRDPTDVEIQALGQAWSEHCCYKSSKVFLREHLLGIETPDLIDRGDAGVMRFDEHHAYALRIESHNHPSAVEPYGGAATGIGGIVRDVLCMGAQPVALADPLFFGRLDIPNDALPAGVKHPVYLMRGVVSGISDYGNRIGIPTVAGGVWFDNSYIGNCIVNVGCVGIAPIDRLCRNRAGSVGEILVLVGGRTGRDGIHGVTFASAVLNEGSEEGSRSAVQLGDPITKEPLIHACLEAVEKGLVRGMKDLGGGGLSCVVGEMVHSAGHGAVVHLDRVPLKEEGLAPWEIWISESQERMMLSVQKENIEALMSLFALYDVSATQIGEVISEPVVRVFYKGVNVLELDLDFYTRGPEYCRQIAEAEPSTSIEGFMPPEPEDYTSTFLQLIGEMNTTSREWVVRRYDQEVRGATVLKPFHGISGHATHGDAAVLKPLEDSFMGLAITVASNPWRAALSPYDGGAGIVDEVCRGLAAVGAMPHALTDCLNFGSPENPEVLWGFKEVVRGIGDVARALSLPIPSGNVSFYNEWGSTPIHPTPVVMGCGISADIRKCVTADLKSQGNPIYLLGPKEDRMGASLYYRLRGGQDAVPQVNIEPLSACVGGLVSAIQAGYVAACHDLSDGGIAAALAEMCIGGQVGAEIDLSSLGGSRADLKLFCEGNTRWLVEARKEKEEELRTLLARVPLTRIGEVRGTHLTVMNGKELLSLDVKEVERTWREPLWRLLG
ncbi:MAG: phosphoribosylformylglycinamidine synthase subunit PurL [Candidatus Thermoplasmatota archaeon]